MGTVDGKHVAPLRDVFGSGVHNASAVTHSAFSPPSPPRFNVGSGPAQRYRNTKKITDELGHEFWTPFPPCNINSGGWEGDVVQQDGGPFRDLLVVQVV